MAQVQQHIELRAEIAKWAHGHAKTWSRKLEMGNTNQESAIYILTLEPEASNFQRSACIM